MQTLSSNPMTFLVPCPAQTGRAVKLPQLDTPLLDTPQSDVSPSDIPAQFLHHLDGRKTLVSTPALATCKVCVIIPVRNEADVLATTLTALAQQVDLNGEPVEQDQYEVIVFANNCTDASAEIARRFARQHSSLILHVAEQRLSDEEAYIGRVRQMLMDEAYCRLITLGQRRGVIASTDADTQVAPTWIAATLKEISAGADAVGGRIMTDRQGRAALDVHAKAYYLRAVGYHFLVAELEAHLDPDPDDPWPRHHQHFGASLAVTAETYALVNGMPAVRTPEDVAFYQALVRKGARFRHSPLVKVITSARQDGRTDLGLANQLNQWSAMGQEQQPYWVESVAAIETRLTARYQLRKILQPGAMDNSLISHRVGQAGHQIQRIAQQLAISVDWLYQELAQTQVFGALYERIEQQQQREGEWQKQWQPVQIEQAIAGLRVRVQQLR